MWGNPVKDSSQDVDFTPCSEVECSGTLPSGAEFEIILPEDWGGSLALFSHGLHGPGAPEAEDGDHPSPADSPTTAAPSPSGTGKKGHADAGASATDAPSPSPTTAEPRPGGPQPAPLWGTGDRAIADVMLQAGYAIAGATPAQEGWSVGAQITAADELYHYFADHVAEPNRVYAWGESTGGLTSVRLAELHPDWVSGAVAMCAPMSGPIPSFDLALDVGFAVRQLLDPAMKLVGYASLEEAQDYRDQAVSLVTGAAGGTARSQAQVAFIAALVSLPNQTRTQPGQTLASRVAAEAEGIANLLDQTTIQRYELEQLVGGNPSGNVDTDYELRISDAQRAQINATSPGATARSYARLSKGARVAPDPEAQRSAAAQGEVVGDLTVPVLTLHNAADPVYIANNESWYHERVAANGPDASANLVNAYALPPVAYSGLSPAPEGAGHCTFDPRTIIGALIQLNDWVRNGQYPGRDTMEKAFKGHRVTLDYDPGPWPSMGVSPLDPPIEPDPATVFHPSASPTSSVTPSPSVSSSSSTGPTPTPSATPTASPTSTPSPKENDAKDQTKNGGKN